MRWNLTAFNSRTWTSNLERRGPQSRRERRDAPPDPSASHTNIRRGMSTQLRADDSVFDRIRDAILNRGDPEDNEDPVGPTVPTG
ncbi:hypothetical protein HBNXHx_0283 [Haloferax volcanii]|nr:hypothetical protein HBNXHx_0283 [Haloferax alexandrinus]